MSKVATYEDLLAEREALEARVAELERENKDLRTIAEARENDLCEAAERAEAWRIAAAEMGWTEQTFPLRKQMAMTRAAMEATGYRRETTMIEGLISEYHAMEEMLTRRDAAQPRTTADNWKE